MAAPVWSLALPQGAASTMKHALTTNAVAAALIGGPPVPAELDRLDLTEYLRNTADIDLAPTERLRQLAIRMTRRTSKRGAPQGSRRTSA